MQREDDEKWLDIYESLPSFVHESHGMQTFIRMVIEKSIQNYQMMNGHVLAMTRFKTA